MRIGRSTLVVCAGLLLAGCGVPTPYQPSDGNEGYVEQRLEADRFRVTVRGNSLTPRETVQNQLLYRAAELTLQHGYERFVVVGQAVEPEMSYYALNPLPYPRRPWWRGFPPAYEAHASTRYDAWAEIKLYKGEPPPGTNVYEARGVIAELRNVVLPTNPG